MIQASELRIGNCIQKLVIDEWVYDTVQARDMLLIYNHPELVKSIPLTEELLLKMGFAKASYGAFWYKLDLMYITIDGNKLYYEHPFHRVNLKYVHQLMNLYHALTGHELTLS